MDESTSLGYNIGLRPARKTGPRLEKEVIGDKIFYHNYGHAGYGVAMSWGSCKIMTTMFASEMGLKHRHVAVIGAGYMGLHTAKQLTELGYLVTIYAKIWPSEWGVFGANTEKKLTSQVAAGLIEMGYFDELFPNRPQTNLIFQESLRYIKDCYENKRYPGFFKHDMYYMEDYDPTSHLIPGSFGPPEKCRVTFGNGREFKTTKTWTFRIDGDLYLNALIKELQKMGVQFVKREFKNRDEICKLNESIVFNCTGFHSKYLFNDPLVFSQKGIMLAFKNQTGVDYYMESFFTKKIKRFAMYPMNQRVCIGLTWIYEEDISKDNDQHHRDLVAEVVRDFNRIHIEIAPKL